MLNKRNKILLGMFTLLLVVFLIYTMTKKDPQQPTITPTPVSFELIKSAPPSQSETTLLDTTSLEFVFNKKIDQSSLQFVSNPMISFIPSTSEDKKILYIRPDPAWKVNTEYRISINIKSADGESLSEKIEYSFKIVEMTDSPLSE